MSGKQARKARKANKISAHKNNTNVNPTKFGSTNKGMSINELEKWFGFDRNIGIDVINNGRERRVNQYRIHRSFAKNSPLMDLVAGDILFSQYDEQREGMGDWLDKEFPRFSSDSKIIFPDTLHMQAFSCMQQISQYIKQGASIMESEVIELVKDILNQAVRKLLDFPLFAPVFEKHPHLDTDEKMNAFLNDESNYPLGV